MPKPQPVSRTQPIPNPYPVPVSVTRTPVPVLSTGYGYVLAPERQTTHTQHARNDSNPAIRELKAPSANFIENASTDRRIVERETIT